MAVESYANTQTWTVGVGGITNVATSLPVSAAATGNLATGQFRILIGTELLLVTGGNATTTWTVTRGVEGTTAASHSAGDVITHVLTDAALKRIVEGRAVVASSDASYDFSSATGLWLPQSAGASPANTGQIAHDTTQHTTKVRDSVFGVGSISRVLGVQYANADTLTAATINTTETAFATTQAIPANYLIAGKVLRIFIGFRFTSSASPVNATLKLRTGTVGAGIVLWTTAAVALLASRTDDTFGLVFYVQGTAAVGASVPVDTNWVQPYGGGSTWSTGRTVQPVNVATNATITLTPTVTFSGNTAGNTVSVRQMVTEELN
jgi:hypothetical protein